MADALDLGSSAYGVGVQLPSPAPKVYYRLLIRQVYLRRLRYIDILMTYIYLKQGHLCGSGSVVERHLAKVNVAGSSPVSRSSKYLSGCSSMVER